RDRRFLGCGHHLVQLDIVASEEGPDDVGLLFLHPGYIAECAREEITEGRITGSGSAEGCTQASLERTGDRARAGWNDRNGHAQAFTSSCWPTTGAASVVAPPGP